MTMLPFYAILLMSGLLVLSSPSVLGDTKLTVTQKIAANTKSNRDIQTNTIAGSSNYVPESQMVNITAQASNVTNSVANTTSSQANVFEASAINGNSSDKDPLISNAQSPNPFLSGMPARGGGGAGGGGGINPQIAMILQNNPRLQMLARQNPVIAQQIMQNPGLLRDPQVQRAIQSQLGPGGSQNLLGQLGQAGLLNTLGRALNPFGLPINPLGQQGGGIGNTGNLNRNRLNQNNLRQGLSQGQGGMNNFGLPRNQQRNPHSDTLPGGYYGDNANYGNPSTGQVANDNNVDGGAGEDESGGEGEASPDYDSAAGGGDESSNAGDDQQQNPAEDPDIQQLQNFGGPINDNFPEGLFPPGLLTKEDIEEIRKQQEKQQREAEEKERQQQSQQGGAEQSPDYDYGNTGEADGSEAGGGGEDGTAEGGQTGSNEENEIDHGQAVSTANPQHHLTHQQQPQMHNNAYTTVRPAAYQNSYQPVQPQAPPRVPIHPQINYANNDYPTPVKNTFNYQPKVEYDQPQQNHGYPVNQYMTTYAPPVQHQNNRMPYQQQPYRSQNSGFQFPSQPYQPRSRHYPFEPEQPRQYHRQWHPGPRQYDNANQQGTSYVHGRPMVFNDEDDQYRHSTPPQPYHYAQNHNQPPNISNNPISPQRPSTLFA